jgi:hypothetical protein
MAEDPEIWVDPHLRPGEWANHVRVVKGSHHFVVDFASLDPHDPSEGTLVSRIILSPNAAGDLQRGLEREWRRYTRDEFG